MAGKKQPAKKVPASKQRSRTTPGNSGEIKVGNVKGNGNVVGHGSSSNVRISNSTTTTTGRGSNDRLLSRMAGFVLTAIGLLIGVALFIRLLNGFDAWTTLGLVLAVFVALLGIMGIIKPEGILSIFGKLLK